MSIAKIHAVAAGGRRRAATLTVLTSIGALLLAAAPAAAEPAGGGGATAKKGCPVTGVNPAGDKQGSTYTVPDGTKVNVKTPSGKTSQWTCVDGSWAASMVLNGLPRVVSSTPSVLAIGS